MNKYVVEKQEECRYPRCKGGVVQFGEMGQEFCSYCVGGYTYRKVDLEDALRDIFYKGGTLYGDLLERV